MGGYAVVPSQLLKWVYAGRISERGLVRRREAEIVLWNQAA
jgi:GH24 family phage-related lysozyme (muramidase)